MNIQYIHIKILFLKTLKNFNLLFVLYYNDFILSKIMIIEFISITLYKSLKKSKEHLTLLISYYYYFYYFSNRFYLYKYKNNTWISFFFYLKKLFFRIKFLVLYILIKIYWISIYYIYTKNILKYTYQYLILFKKKKIIIE